uniref:Disease resistance R13L4/SHOC-2-like LRR domain-containing protein n=1 Tax=Arion vulgaris TaxID=1028688 RepID=A0A0B6ZAJ4_9EUPU
MSQSLTARNIRLRIETEDPLYYGQKKLKMQGRDLLHLPKAVFKLMELEVLDLSPEREACLDYKLSTVPADIGKLLNLRALLLDTNELVQVPVEITLLINLERLALSNNHLSHLPNGFKRLKKLTSLHLANNKFTTFPAEVCDITSLVFLDFSDNLIKKLPMSVSQLKSLETLLLFINKLTQLPDSIVQMTELRCLWLGNNHIRALPTGFGYLTKLDWKERYTSSTLDGNPLERPPLDICRMGPESIERYQGVGPNIDAQKQLGDEFSGDRRRSRATSDAYKGLQGYEFGDESTLTNKSQTDVNKTSTSFNEEYASKALLEEASDRKYK